MMGVGIASAAALSWLIALSSYDIRERRLPNVLTLPGVVVVLTLATATGRGVGALAGCVALFGIYLTVHLLVPAAMGAGDVKLALGVGALTGAFGADVWMLAAIAAPLLTAVWALTSVVIDGRRRTVPHGPSMCAAAAVATALALS